MDIKDAQTAMRFAYLGGAPGLFVSALVWLTASAVALTGNSPRAVLTLLAGGVLIFPLSVLATKLLGRPGAHAKDNPLGPLALEGTAFLLIGCCLAFALSQFRIALFFPAMLLVIGARYLTFQTLYGLRAYWICGGILIAGGFAAVMLALPPAIAALIGGLTELIFAGLVYARERR